MSTWFLIHEEYAGVAGLLLVALALAVLGAYLVAEMFRDWLEDRKSR